MSRTDRSLPSNPKAGRPLPPLLDASELQAGIRLQAAPRAVRPPEPETRSDSTTTNPCSSELVSASHRPLPALLEPSHEQRAELVFLDESADVSEEGEDEQVDGAGRGTGTVPPRERNMLQEFANNPELLASFERYWTSSSQLAIRDPSLVWSVKPDSKSDPKPRFDEITVSKELSREEVLLVTSITRRRLGAHGFYVPASKYSPSPSECFRNSPLGYTDGNISSEDIMHSDEEALYLSSPLSALSIQKESSKATTSIVVTSAMTVSEVKIVLGDHGCTDLTDALDHQSCSEWAISQGGFSDIYSGKMKDGKPVAIKALRLLASSEESGKQVKHAARELHTWSKCRHPNVIELLGLVDFRGRLAMVSPWMPNGSVRLYLATHPDADRCGLCYGVSDGLAYLHESTIVHGDLKGANVLLSDQGIPKLTDIGNSALSDCSMLYTKTNSETSLSPRWTAPEIFNGGTHSYAADVFALGMTLLETITGDIPYHDLQQDLAVIMAIGILKKLPKRPEAHIPSKSEQGNALWSLLTRCWSYMPEDRPTAPEIRDKIKYVTPQGLM